jgi:hypothetical protein
VSIRLRHVLVWIVPNFADHFSEQSSNGAVVHSARHDVEKGRDILTAQIGRLTNDDRQSLPGGCGEPDCPRPTGVAMDSVRTVDVVLNKDSSAIPILLANSCDQMAMSRANFEWRVLELGVSVSQASMR